MSRPCGQLVEGLEILSAAADELERLPLRDVTGPVCVQAFKRFVVSAVTDFLTQQLLKGIAVFLTRQIEHGIQRLQRSVSGLELRQTQRGHGASLGFKQTLLETIALRELLTGLTSDFVELVFNGLADDVPAQAASRFLDCTVIQEGWSVEFGQKVSKLSRSGFKSRDRWDMLIHEFYWGYCENKTLFFVPATASNSCQF